MIGSMYIVVVIVILATIALIIAAIWSVRSCTSRSTCCSDGCDRSGCGNGPECILSCQTSNSCCGGSASSTVCDSSSSSSSSSSCGRRRRRSRCTDLAQLWLSGATTGVLTAGAPVPLPLIAVGPTSGITIDNDVVTNLNATPGTVITLASAGVYEINWQAFFTSAPDGVALSLAVGADSDSLAQLPYTIVGSSSLSPSLSGSFLVTASADGTALALIAAVGNTSTISVPATTGVTNVSATTLSIKRIS